MTYVYQSDVDTHVNGTALLNYRGFISGVHDEYWSKPMYDNVTAARDGGVNLFFSSANAIYWQIRFESSAGGVPNRVIVCYRDSTIDPTTDPTLTTVNWRDPPLNRPEQELIGIMFTDIVDQNAQGNYAPYVVTNSSNWVYAGTGFKDGDSVGGVVGYEADRLFSTYSGPSYVPGTYTLLSHSPFKASGASDYANSSIYQAPSGAWVFASGTIQWANTLDGFNPSGLSIVDPRLQQTTANVLNQFISNSTVGDFTLTASPTMPDGHSWERYKLRNHHSSYRRLHRPGDTQRQWIAKWSHRQLCPQSWDFLVDVFCKYEFHYGARHLYGHRYGYQRNSKPYHHAHTHRQRDPRL